MEEFSPTMLDSFHESIIPPHTLPLQGTCCLPSCCMANNLPYPILYPLRSHIRHIQMPQVAECRQRQIITIQPLNQQKLSLPYGYKKRRFKKTSLSDSVGSLSDSAGIPLYRKRKTLIISDISLLYKNYSLISCRKKIDFFSACNALVTHFIYLPVYIRFIQT